VARNEQRSSNAGRSLQTGTKSGFQRLSVRGEFSAHFEDGFQIEVAGVWDIC
jgi:hypothetical protein